MKLKIAVVFVLLKVLEVCAVAGLFYASWWLQGWVGVFVGPPFLSATGLFAAMLGIIFVASCAYMLVGACVAAYAWYRQNSKWARGIVERFWK